MRQCNNYILPEPFVLKNSSIGWWVDGYWGYLYVGYFETKQDALNAFWEKYKGE